MTIEPKARISIVMPAYNEEENIEKTVLECVTALSGLPERGEIVVTDDGSKDSTGKILEGLKSRVPNLKVVTHPRNMGYGAALKSALSASDGEYIVTIDSDGQFNIGELPLFLENSPNGEGVVTGYRKKKNDTAFRVFANKGLNALIAALFGIRLKDINCAFRLYKRDALKRINIESRGYQAPSEIMIKLNNLGFAAREVGVEHYARKGGQSALKPLKTIAETTAFLVYLKLKTSLYRRGLLNSL